MIEILIMAEYKRAGKIRYQRNILFCRFFLSPEKMGRGSASWKPLILDVI